MILKTRKIGWREPLRTNTNEIIQWTTGRKTQAATDREAPRLQSLQGIPAKLSILFSIVRIIKFECEMFLVKPTIAGLGEEYDSFVKGEDWR